MARHTTRTLFPGKAEEELKLAFFGEQARGYFVEVGANGPKYLSQTWEMERRGWNGVLVEPQPSLVAELRKHRSALVFEAACSSRRNAGTEMTLQLCGGNGGQSSLEPRPNEAGVRPYGQLKVFPRTLDEILAEANAPAPIDFVSIDVEGHEVDVIDGFDLARWRPRLIIIEDLLLGLKLHHQLTRRGYRWIRRTGINNWYLPRAAAQPLGLFGWLQFVNKHYLGTPSRRLRAGWRRLVAKPQIAPPHQERRCDS
jgi:FkbM family methyltransferase